jgi:hypothetical protein
MARESGHSERREHSGMRVLLSVQVARPERLRVAAGARASGRAFRVIRRKNPPRSMVIYRDDWQVALLPDRD